MLKTNQRLIVILLGFVLSFGAFAVPPAYFHCGDSKVKAYFYDENKLLLTIDGKEYELISVMSGSGAKYETLKGTHPFVMFWNKGTEATLEVGYNTYPLCHQEKAPVKKATTILEREWKVESIGNKAVVGEVPLTVMFKQSDKIVGFSGCNRFGGTYVLIGGKLVIKQNRYTTRKACLSDDLMEQEMRFLALLATMTHVKLEKGELRLSNDKQEQILLR